MRKLIVSNLVSLDGYYERKDRNLEVLFDYFHQDYSSDDSFDFYNAERLRAADTLLLSGRTSFFAFKEYWSNVMNNPNITVVRQEMMLLANSSSRCCGPLSAEPGEGRLSCCRTGHLPYPRDQTIDVERRCNRDIL